MGFIRYSMTTICIHGSRDAQLWTNFGFMTYISINPLFEKERRKCMINTGEFHTEKENIC